MYNIFSHCSKLLLFTLAITGYTFMTNNIVSTGFAQANADGAGNPLLAKWEGPYGGTPPFTRVKVSDLKPALEAAMAENLTEVGRIASDNAVPNFETRSPPWSVQAVRSNALALCTACGAQI